jgi:hypothetical protein
MSYLDLYWLRRSRAKVNGYFEVTLAGRTF